MSVWECSSALFDRAAPPISSASVAGGGDCGRAGLSLHDEGSAVTAWQLFGVWLVLGLGLYFAYGFRHSTLRRGAPPASVPPASSNRGIVL